MRGLNKKSLSIAMALALGSAWVPTVVAQQAEEVLEEENRQFEQQLGLEYTQEVAMPDVGSPSTGEPGTVGYASGATSESTEGLPSLWYQLDVRGDYVAKGVGMRNRGYGKIALSGIPVGATIKAAYLYWTILNPTELANFKNGTVTTGKTGAVSVTGMMIGSGQDPCWNAGQGYAYWANITNIVTAEGNGTYNLSGFASGRTDGADPWLVGSNTPMAEGATIVVIFEKLGAAPYPWNRIQIFDGYAMTSGPTLSISPNWGFAATNPAPPVRTTFIGADGQKLSEPGSTFNGRTILPPYWDGKDSQSPYAKFSQGNLWDTETASVGKFVNPGNTSATITVTGGSDCIAWVAQVISVGHSGAVDTDGDALLDGWEANGHDFDGNGTIDVDLPKFRASTVKKDLFVEMDYMSANAAYPSHLPLKVDLDRIKKVFSSAPFANNPNGTTGIALHMDAGSARGTAYNLGGGNLVPYDADLNPLTTEFNAIKAANFNPRRAKTFYYMIWAHGYNGGSSSGNAFAIPNDSFVVTLGLWAGGGNADQKVGTFVHEFGHDLGLYHGGNENKLYKPNYLSVMNYAFQTTGIPKTGTTAPDFGYSRADLPDLNELSLNENVGLASTLAKTFRTRWYCPSGALTTSTTTANGPLDWNCNGVATNNPVSVNLNGAADGSTLTGWKDWGNLVFGGGAVGAGIAEGGIEVPQSPLDDREMTFEEHQRLFPGAH